VAVTFHIGALREQVRMRGRVFLIFSIFFLLAVGENTWGQGFYKWVDERTSIFQMILLRF
jgi:hypothetical protein